MVYWLTRAASWLCGRVPRRLRIRLAGPLTELIYFGWVAKRRVTIANMAIILGTSPRDPRAKRLARHSWRNYGRYISDFFYMPNATQAELLVRMRDDRSSPGTFDIVDQAKAHGKGVLIATAHFGAWDTAGVLLASHTPLHAVVESFADPRMDEMIQRQREALGVSILRMEKSPRQLLRVLEQNGVIAVVIDRPLPPGEGVAVTFFGRRCWVPGGVAQLALKTGAVIVPGYARYDADYSDAYYIGALEPIVPQPTGDKKADVATLTQQMFDALEVIIRAYPDQWAMFRRFWPEEEVPVAGSLASRGQGGARVARLEEEGAPRG